MKKKHDEIKTTERMLTTIEVVLDLSCNSKQ